MAWPLGHHKVESSLPFINQGPGVEKHALRISLVQTESLYKLVVFAASACWHATSRVRVKTLVENGWCGGSVGVN